MLEKMNVKSDVIFDKQTCLLRDWLDIDVI